MRQIPANIRCTQCQYDLRGLAWSGQCPECGRSIDQSVQDVLGRRDRSAEAQAIAAAQWEELRLPISLIVGGLLAIAFRVFVVGLSASADQPSPSLGRDIAWPLFVEAVGAGIGFAVAARMGLVCFFSYLSIGLTGAAVATVSTAVLALLPSLGWLGGGLVVPMLLIWWLARPNAGDVMALLLVVWGTMVGVGLVALFLERAVA